VPDFNRIIVCSDDPVLFSAWPVPARFSHPEWTLQPVVKLRLLESSRQSLLARIEHKRARA
jgi:hypothetical protein